VSGDERLHAATSGGIDERCSSLCADCPVLAGLPLENSSGKAQCVRARTCALGGPGALRADQCARGRGEPCCARLARSRLHAPRSRGQGGEPERVPRQDRGARMVQSGLSVRARVAQQGLTQRRGGAPSESRCRLARHQLRGAGEAGVRARDERPGSRSFPPRASDFARSVGPHRKAVWRRTHAPGLRDRSQGDSGLPRSVRQFTGRRGRIAHVRDTGPPRGRRAGRAGSRQADSLPETPAYGCSVKYGS
jgi:hypothetical protein